MGLIENPISKLINKNVIKNNKGIQKKNGGCFIKENNLINQLFKILIYKKNTIFP